jgi:hypothetical protein
MIRFLLRLLAMLILAAGFAALIVDGTRSIAGSELNLTPLSDLLRARLPAIEQSVTRNVHPLLWDPVLKSFFRLPAWLVLAMAGLLLLKLGRRPVPPLGGHRET